MSSPVFPAPTAKLSWYAILALAGAVVACRLIAIGFCPIYDDAFITFRYAENLAHGKGLVFNPGAPWEPVLGTTTPAYALLLAGLVRLGADVIPAALTVNVLCDAISAVLIAELLGRRALATAIAVAAFASVPQIARISAGGMEPPLFVALALSSVLLIRASRPTAAGVVAALSCLVRPEALFLLAALAWSKRHARGELVRFALPVVVIGLASVLTINAIYGQPLPQSVVAKASHSDLFGRFTRAKDILRDSFLLEEPSRYLFPLVAIGLARGILGGSRLMPFFVQALGMVAAYMFVGTKAWGWYYYVPLSAWAIGLGLGCESVVERLPRLVVFNRPNFLTRTLAPGFALAAVAALSLVAATLEDMVTPRVYEAFEAWAREQRIAERGAVVLASDIGMVGYYSDARILDSEGLVWPQALGFKGQIDLLRQFRPEYVVWVVNKYRLGAFLQEEELLRSYRPVRRFNIDNDADLSPDPRKFTRSWEQDYVVYERIEELTEH